MSVNVSDLVSVKCVLPPDANARKQEIWLPK